MFVQEFLIRYAIFSITALLLLRGVYFRATPNREVLLGLFMFGNGVFFITYLLHGVEMSMGFAFGLFAVFSMLRYRTEALTIRDMTYLFTTIVISLMCAVAEINLYEISALCAVIIVLAGGSETQIFAPTITERHITYDRIDKIQPTSRDSLIAEVRERTGMNVIKIELGKVDFLNDSVLLTVFCEEEG
jgi:hypothetical protein